MRRRVTGLSLPWAGLQWENVPGDAEIARATVTFLEDRRVLFNTPPHEENDVYAYDSVLEIRKFLTEQITKSRPGKSLDASLRAMRAACRMFIASSDGPAPAGYLVKDDVFMFERALGELRARIGDQLALIVTKYDLELEEELAEILPSSDDGSDFVPGFS
jgi:Family of unknown function (DUF6650)